MAMQESIRKWLADVQENLEAQLISPAWDCSFISYLLGCSD